ncbi:MAG TPA: hypothetical protein PLQ35_16155 [bacterium]|nr:hypothetical protein [bacterium]HQL63812.1 hypothetical protein [bacterium]
MTRIVLVRSKDLQKDLLNAVFEMLVAVPGPLEFEQVHKPVKIEGDSDTPADWNSIFAACRAFRQQLSLDENDFLVLLMAQRNQNNWFSSCDPQGEKSIFIHASEWENYVTCPPEYPVAFQVVENILQCLMFDTLADGAQFFHDPPIGCISDMCSWKPDVIFKLRTADICPECQRVIGDRGICEDVLTQMLQLLETQRSVMLFRTRMSTGSQGEEFPFPISITRRKISGTTEPFRRFLMLLDHFDSLVRCTVITCGCIAMKDNFDEFFRERELHERPSLGHWVTALRNLSQMERVNVPDFPSRLFERIRRVVDKAEEEEIVSLRNEKRGHGYCDCNDTAYKQLFLEHIDTVTEVENLLRPIYIRIRWYYTISMSQSDPGTFSFTVKDLSGDHPDFKEISHEIRPKDIADIPQTYKVYAITPDRTWHKLSPYAMYCDCPACGHHRVLVSDGEMYIDPYVGHRVRLDCAL